MAANNMLHNTSTYLKKSFLICGIKPHLICRMTSIIILIQKKPTSILELDFFSTLVNSRSFGLSCVWKFVDSCYVIFKMSSSKQSPWN